MSTIGSIAIGEVVMLEWNHEPVQLIYKSDCRAVIRSLNVNGGDPEREISPGTAVLPYEGQGLGSICACGCGRIVTGTRSTRIYATNACRIKAFRHNGTV